MKVATLVGSVLLCAGIVASPAAATEYFYDDFNDGVMDGWTQLTQEDYPFAPPPEKHNDFITRDAVMHGHYGKFAYGHNEFGGRDSVLAEAPLSGAALADTIHISWDYMHSGEFQGTGGGGTKYATLGLINDAGEGFGWWVSLDKAADPAAGTFEVQETTDGGETWGGAGGISVPLTFEVTPSSFELQHFEVIWRRTGGPPAMTILHNGEDKGTYMLDTFINNDNKDPTKILAAPGQNISYREDIVGAALFYNNLWVGDESNPNTVPTLDKGDTNGDLYVDIQDLTALANNWSALSPGSKNWREGDFNYNWTVDIEDLTALANNWTGAPPGGEVPEPATLALLVLGATTALLRRRS